MAGRSPPRTIDHQELVFKEEIFGEDRLDAARSQQRSQCGHQMREQREQVSHHRETLREALPSDKTAKCIHSTRELSIAMHSISGHLNPFQ